jgi:hypothetical protein
MLYRPEVFRGVGRTLGKFQTVLRLVMNGSPFVAGESGVVPGTQKGEEIRSH